MKRLAVAAVLLSSALAFAADAPAAPGMDLTKMGPGARKPTNEKQTKKDIEAWLKSMEELTKKGDLAACAAGNDYPLFMVTDDVKGNVESAAWSKEQWMAEMKPFFENMSPDMQVKHKYTITVLSDALAYVGDDATMVMGKTKVAGKNAALVVKTASGWKWKFMAEAGWGGMGAPPKDAAAPAADPGKKAAAAPVPAPPPAPAPAKK